MTRKTFLKEVPKETTKRNNLKISIDDLLLIKPQTINQSKFFNQYDDSDFFILNGYPGTGKSFIALYKALEEVLEDDQKNKELKVIIIRSAVPTRDLGALPGNLDEKLEIYEQPYINICSKLFRRNDAYQRLKEQKKIEFFSTSYLRSMTFDNSNIIFDEFQNADIGELETVASRVGTNSKLILCGDYLQNDLKKSNDRSGFLDFMEIAKYISNTIHIEFNNVEDICRSGFVRNFILAKIKSQNAKETSISMQMPKK